MKKRSRAIICGSCAGFINGLFGTAGGTVIVVLFTRWLKLPQKQALASAVTIMLALSLISTIVYFNRISVNWPSAWWYIAGGFAGGAVGGKIFKNVNNGLLRKMFALFVIWAGVRGLLT